MVKVLHTRLGKMAFAVLCDGMGGLSEGETASATVVSAFNRWLCESLPLLCENPIHDDVIRAQWEGIVAQQNRHIINYGKEKSIKLGTTAVILLLTDSKYYIMNVGDSRAYEIDRTLRQITRDQTLAERELELGNMTIEQARDSPNSHVLLQCVGASDTVQADMFCGDLKQNATYMLCSDGFYHKITEREIFNTLLAERMTDRNCMINNLDYLVKKIRLRDEQDNISVIIIRTISHRIEDCTCLKSEL